MTLRYRTEGMVLRKEDDLENSRIFWVFTKDFGRIQIVGKGIRKIDSKLKGGIEIFSWSDIEFIQGRHKKTLTDTTFLKRFNNILNNISMLETAHKISQLADNFIKGEEPDEHIWNLLVDSFEKLNHLQLQERSCSLVYCYFFWNFISLLGYKPELSNCVNCQKKLNPYELYFSNKEGGLICKSCSAQKQDGLKITSDTVKILRLILNKDWNVLRRVRMEGYMHESLQQISDHYYSYLKSSLSNEVKTG